MTKNNKWECKVYTKQNFYQKPFAFETHEYCHRTLGKQRVRNNNYNEGNDEEDLKKLNMTSILTTMM